MWFKKKEVFCYEAYDCREVEFGRTPIKMIGIIKAKDGCSAIKKLKRKGWCCMMINHEGAGISVPPCPYSRGCSKYGRHESCEHKEEK